MEREIEDDESSPLIPQPQNKSALTKALEVEVRLYRRGKGPIAEFKSGLGGWDRDQLEVGEICDKYGFKSVYAFNPESGRGVPIRFNPKNGRSLLPYKDGATIIIDGEPKDSLLMPITKIILGLAVSTLLIVFVMRDNPKWMEKLNISGGRVPPWVLAGAVIVFTRMRKRTKDFFQNRG